MLDEAEEKSKNWQKPKANHPWRQYHGKVAADGIKVQEKKIKSVKILITEFAESWDKIKVVTSAFGREGEFLLIELPQSKQAAWLASLLRRHYA